MTIIPFFSGYRRILAGLIATGLVLSPIALPEAQALGVQSASTIEDSDENPTVVITITDATFKADVAVSNFTVTVNRTGLTFANVARDSDTQVTLGFTGVAARGNIDITVLGTSYNESGQTDFSFQLDVRASILASCSVTPTEPCVNAGTAANADGTVRTFQVQRSNASLSGGAYGAFQFLIHNGSNFLTAADGDTFSDVEILYPTSDAIGADFKTASFAMASAADFDFSKSLVTVSGSEFVKWTISFTARMTTNKDGCDRDTNTFGSGANSVCEAENGEYINMVSDSVDIFSPDTIGADSDSDGGFVSWVGSSFSWGSSAAEPFQFQLVGPKFRPTDRSSSSVTTTQSSQVEANAGALKIFLPTALATSLYGVGFDPVLTRKDNISGSVVANALDSADGLVITRPTGGYLLEIASHPFSAPVFAVSTASISPSAPAVYSGPLVTRSSLKQVSSGDVVSISGERLAGITKVSIDGKSADVSKLTATGFDIVLPSGLTAGPKNLMIESNLGNLTFLNAFEVVVTEAKVLAKTTHSWTKKLDGATAKMYAKNIVGAGKVQFMFNGEEIAWVRAEDTADPKLRLVEESNYLVRTVELVEGQKNVLEVYLDGERVRRTAYSR